MSQQIIYLDHNATTPVFPEVAQAIQDLLPEHWGNPSSTHARGKLAKMQLDTARAQVATMLGADPGEIVFTSCGTESDSWAIWGAVTGPAGRAHPAILRTLDGLAEQGLLSYTLVGTSPEGQVSPAAVRAALTEATVLCTLMHSNNETGALQPVKETAGIARQHGILMHSDAAQSIGKVPVNMGELGVDLLTIVGHKFGAPKGVAALYIRSGVQLGPMFMGGGQESGRRAGTENVLLAAALGVAAGIVSQELESNHQHMQGLRDSLQHQLLQHFGRENLHINGPTGSTQRLPNTLSISIRGLQATQLLEDLSSSLAASAGAACHSGQHASMSHVLEAMQVPLDLALGTLRISVGRHTTQEDVDSAVRLIAEAAQRHR
eukprot:jgi/Astpho2/329/fgenesh1_pm.00010_%23_29_t